MTGNELISVIIPVYNNSETIKGCVESCLRQTYKNLEIILVDDGSTDGSKDLCDQLANKHESIKVYHKSNEGVSSARNCGLEYCTGEYITFLDSDDMLHPAAIERLYRALNETGKDLAFCCITLVHTQEQLDRIMKTSLDDQDYCIKASELYFRIIYKDPICGSCCGKLYRRNLIGTHRFRSLTMSEDQVFLFEILFENEGDVVLAGKSPMYCYIQRENSTVHSLSYCHFHDSLESCDYVLKIAEIKRGDYEKAALCNYVNNAFFVLLNSSGVEEHQELSSNAMKIIRKYRLKMITNAGIPLKTKGACILSYMPATVLSCLYHMTKRSLI